MVAWRDTVVLVGDSRRVTVRVVARNGARLASVNPATETCDS